MSKKIFQFVARVRQDIPSKTGMTATKLSLGMIPGLRQCPEPSQAVAGTVQYEAMKLKTLLFNNSESWWVSCRLQGK